MKCWKNIKTINLSLKKEQKELLEESIMKKQLFFAENTFKEQIKEY